MAEETNRPIVEAQQESTKVLSEAIAKLEKTVATSNGATEEGQTQLKDAVLSTAKPDPKVKETEDKQSSFLERIQKSMQGMNLANAKEKMGAMRTDAAEAFQKRKDAIMNSRSVGLLKTMSGNITKFTKGFLGSIKDKAKMGIKGFLIATGLLMLINFLESEEWTKMKKKLKEFDFVQLGKDIDELIAGFSNIGEGVLGYFLGKKTGEKGERDDTGLFSRLGKIKRSFTHDGLIEGFKSMFDNLSGVELLLGGALGLYFAKKTGILFLAGKIFGKKGLFSLLFKALGGVAAYFGIMKPAVDAMTKKTLKQTVKANPKLGKAHMTKDGKIIREFTESGKRNPNYDMAKNMSKPATKPAIDPKKIKPPKPAPNFGKLQAMIAKKNAAKMALKKVPVAGAIAGSIFGIMKLLEGDAVGASLEFASGAASTMPGAGTAASAGIDVAIIMREMSKIQEILPKLEKEQAELQKKMAARARVAEMFGLKDGEGLRGKSAEELKAMVANFKERFGSNKISEEQKKMLLESGFFKKTLFGGGVAELAGDSFNMSNLKRMQQLMHVMNEDDSKMAATNKGLTEFIDQIKAMNGELAAQKKLMDETGGAGGGNTQVVDARDQSKKEYQSAPVEFQPGRNVHGFAGFGVSPW